ncbi:MAG: endonuclease MutS2, partial [Eubacterium sp.]
STVFIEPMAVVKLNNELRELTVQEQDEIEKILINISTLLSEHIDAIKNNMNLISKLDFIFARASLAKKLNCSRPEFNDKKYINIKQGRHPLLDQKKVVPIDIYLGDEFDLLIITGPNTGGKTVSLKTVGLLTLMGQAGLHIPAFDGSSLGIFDDVFSDIGDEQSIEQNLSTFSAHMTNIIDILKNANSNSLVLFDELGAGTDPTEGAALAMSILSFLHNMQIRTIATTHYSELKLFALSTPNVSNACCEFNVETLKPTYRLLIGIPGKSNAFAISQKLGLPEHIIKDAKTRINAEDKAFEDVISELEANKSIIEQERAEIATYKKEIEHLKLELETKYLNIEERKEKILITAREEAKDILKEAKEYADRTIRDINKYSKAGSNRNLEETRNRIGNKLRNTQQDLSIKKPSLKGTNKPEDFNIGTHVHVISFNLDGIVASLPNAKGDLYVSMGSLHSQVNIKDLQIISVPSAPSSDRIKTGAGKIKMSKSLSVPTEINLLGKTVDEAIAILDKYLDDAYLAHLTSVSIIHGKGTGALRNGVHNFLRRSKYVKSYRLGTFGEGDAGVTIVEFK